MMGMGKADDFRVLDEAQAPAWRPWVCACGQPAAEGQPDMARRRMGAALAFSALLLTPSAWAFRCNSFVIDAGMAKPEVLRKCGTPSLQEQRLDRRVIRLRVPAAPNSASVVSV